MKWITREKPKIDRIATPWLINRYIDSDAEFLFVPFDKVLEKAAEFKAIPFDIPNVEYSHYGPECTFDFVLKKHDLTDPALKKLALIVRGADTDRHELAPEAAGLFAIFSGLSHTITQDQELLRIGFQIYDGLYFFLKHFSQSRHLENSPFEKQLHEVYQKILAESKSKKNSQPKWVKELKGLIQDHLDSQFSLDLKQAAQLLQINPSYLSREFSKHFEELNFGDYVRIRRIERSEELILNTDYSLTEIAYLTGFSDQSHFTRIFRQVKGLTPTAFRKKYRKSKDSSKSKNPSSMALN
ncbi:helix-turn-helix domain-containing protein [Algoriphagus lacus]|uniref:Helix-turn-helix domain-containing protein n=1 Tax=Algoriphagus lacus TaxID=2056311 RepID=A0A418PRU5_9BACT|nr:chromate resistance protein ChrB domain-containing protein [Algoriphagus lacus]RIW15572.1 helix-turn-helix domain-containing protein [Algoriphagus lacus]